MSKLQGHAQPGFFWAFTRDDELVATCIVLSSTIVPIQMLELVDGYEVNLKVLIDGIAHTITTLWEYDPDDTRLFLEYDEFNRGPAPLDGTCMMPLHDVLNKEA